MLLAGIETRWHAALNGGTSLTGNSFGSWCATTYDRHITAVTVTVKMPAGYDTDHNDWWWAIYEEDGKVAQMSGKVQVCIACHQPAAAMDYVFSQKVMEEIHK